MYNLEDIRQFKEMCEDVSILMLDDEEMITQSYGDIASRFFDFVEISNNPVEVLQNYDAQKHDIIYTDLNMPHMNGIELIRAIKKINVHQKFIVISASDDIEKLLELLSLNVSGFIVKPFNLQKFIEVSMDQVSIILQNRLRKEEQLKLREELLNVTEEKVEQEEMLIQQSKLAQTGEMISMISHQWRQPLSSITTVVAGIKTRLELGVYENKENPLDAITSDLLKAFEKIETTASFLSKTINDFRNFYSPDKKEALFNIYNSMRTVFEMLNVDQHSIDFTIECVNAERTNVVTFESELKQVLLCIINNAVDALKENNISSPKVSVSIESLENVVVIYIRDNAGGVPEDIIDNIFLPYFSTKTEKNGTGLGLHMAKTIVEEHIKGYLSVVNSNVFNGAEFVIHIPKNQG